MGGVEREDEDEEKEEEEKKTSITNRKNNKITRKNNKITAVITTTITTYSYKTPYRTWKKSTETQGN